MKLPGLKPSGRSREYEKYDAEMREDVVYAFLFDGLHYRQMDDLVMGLDSSYTKGFQSMGIIHYLGLNDFKGIFRCKSIDEVLEDFPSDEEYDFLYELLDRCRIRKLSAEKDL